MSYVDDNQKAKLGFPELDERDNSFMKLWSQHYKLIEEDAQLKNLSSET